MLFDRSFQSQSATTAVNLDSTIETDDSGNNASQEVDTLTQILAMQEQEFLQLSLRRFLNPSLTNSSGF
jgi:hypothetical protein